MSDVPKVSQLGSENHKSDLTLILGPILFREYQIRVFIISCQSSFLILHSQHPCCRYSLETSVFKIISIWGHDLVEDSCFSLSTVNIMIQHTRHILTSIYNGPILLFV